MTATRLGIGSIAIALAAAADARAVEVDQARVAAARGQFIESMASEHGLDRDELTDLLSQAQIDTRVLEAMSRPAERVMPWHEYQSLFLSEARIDGGVRFWLSHAERIDSVAERYAVAPELLVAILGVETFFGERTGRYRVLDSLATLAFAYPPRAGFFTGELEAFLLLAREEALDPLRALGSYAGAMGAGQFIPTSYRAYAVDADGDGRRDLWSSWEDVLGSVANYFKVHGWRDDEPVVERATLGSSWSEHAPQNGLDLSETVGSLTRQGYVFVTELPESAPAGIFALEGRDETEHWVGYHNFYVITRYNRSAMYALAVHQLSQAILHELQRAVGDAQ